MGLDDRHEELREAALEGEPVRPRRRLEEVRYQAAAKRATRKRRADFVALIVGFFFGVVVVGTTISVFAIIIGGAVWVLTGKPMFG